MQGRSRPAVLEVPADGPSPFSLTESGTFTEGDLVVGRAGLTIGGAPGSAGERGGGESTPPDTAGRAWAPLGALGRVTPVGSRGVTPVGGSRGGTPLRGLISRGSSRGASGGGGAEGALDGGLAGVDVEQLVDAGVLGKGSSGVVRKVVHRETGHELAVKTIPIELQDDARRLLVQELRALSACNSPFVVQHFESFCNEGEVTIVMEYMDGGSLSSLVRRRGPLPEACLGSVARQVLQGLAYLHDEKRIVHRDLKPSNLLVNAAGEVKISDFGVSGQLGASVSKCASWVGTVTYMSPERISGEKYGPDSDIWSLGLSLVECALGRFPYPPPGEAGEHKMGFWDLLHFIVEKPPAALPRSDFSREFCDFTRLCLQKDPAARPTARFLLEHPFLTSREVEEAILADFL